MRLTEAGALLHARTGPLLGEIAEVGASVGGGLDKPRGRLRVSAPLLLSDTQLGRVAATFVRAYTEVDLEIHAEDRFVDPVDEDFDVVIRVNSKPDERLVGRCVLRDEQWLVAEPGAVPPESVDGSDVVDLPSVVRSPPRPGETWCVHGGRDRRSYRPVPVLRLSALPTLRDAVVAGAGPQRGDPLSCVLWVTPCRLMRGVNQLGGISEGWNRRLCLLPLGRGVTAVASSLAVGECLFPGFGEANEPVATEPDIASPALHDDAQEPAFSA